MVIGPGDIEVALRVLMTAAGMSREAQQRELQHVAVHGGSLVAVGGVLRVIGEDLTRKGLFIPEPTEADRLRAAAELMTGLAGKTGAELRETLADVGCGELTEMTETITRFAERVGEAAWIAARQQTAAPG